MFSPAISVLRYITTGYQPFFTRTGAVFFITCLLIILPQQVFARTDDGTKQDSCQTVDSLAPKITAPPRFSTDKLHNTYISADSSRSLVDGSTLLQGRVIILKNQLRIHSDRADYNQKKNTLQVNGNVHVDIPSLSLDADKATFSLSGKAKHAVFMNSRFILPLKSTGRNKTNTQNLKGIAASITSSGNISLLKQAEITSCPLNKPDWLISADSIELNHAEEYGRAHGVLMRFKGVPFLYTPYIEFPTSNKRRSGLLFPEFGTSSSRGFEFAQPWYWNIAPNMDATFTPHYMNRRGIELGGEYRYLTKSGNGTLQGSYLNNDKITSSNRYQLRYQQHTKFMSSLRMNIDLQDISDKNYFNDFSNSLGATSRTYLDRSASLSYDTTNWHMRALAQKLKTIDTDTPVSSRPYARLPQLTLDGGTAIGDNGLQFTLDSALVEFAHEDNNIATGSRIIMQPGINWPLSGAAWFFNPALKFSLSQYNVGPNSGSKQTINRSLPLSSIDTGLFFERTLNNGLLQTLEPRLYYLNVPYRQQNNIPLFDSSMPDFNISQLFRDNRFNGQDRIGDANQITLALTSRLLDPVSGIEKLRASIGQIFYFSDRRVSLNGTTETRKQSDIIAEMNTTWGRWLGNIDVQWNPDKNRFSKENYFIHYQSDEKHLFNIGYRKRLQSNNTNISIKQTDTSFVLPVTTAVNVYARWNYSLKDNRNIDMIGGFSYNGCCWSLQLLMQRRLQNSTSVTPAYNNSLLVQFVLKGLGNLSGSTTQTTLGQSIYGYHDTLQ